MIKGDIRFGLWSSSNDSTFPPGLLRSGRVPSVTHVMINVLHIFPRPARLSSDETWTPDNFEHVKICSLVIKEGLPNNSDHIILRPRRDIISQTSLAFNIAQTYKATYMHSKLSDHETRFFHMLLDLNSNYHFTKWTVC